MKKVIIAGAGAAGLMAAAAASEAGKKVILLEKNEKPGKKLFITGKGRCNITNACAMPQQLNHIATNAKFLYSAFDHFTNEDIIAFLERQGVKTKTERGQRVFPVSDHSSDVIGALVRACEENQVLLRCHAQVKEILLDEEGRFRAVKLKNGEVIEGDSLVIATGGCSYPSTGSSGDGYALAKSLGHTIKEPQPSLVPFVMKEDWCKALMGLTLKNVSIQIKCGKKKIYEGFGELLFTHFGVSGPLVLTGSTRLGNYKKDLEGGKLTIHLDLKPALDREQLEKRLLREFDTWRNKNISNVADQLLPRKMVPVFLREAGIPEEKKVRDITRQERRKMIETMKEMVLHIKALRGFDEAIVTRGGVHVKEVNPATMESKKIKNVFFAGELLNVDAETGGYNLQIAWSTGYTAGINA